MAEGQGFCGEERVIKWLAEAHLQTGTNYPGLNEIYVMRETLYWIFPFFKKKNHCLFENVFITQ